MFYEGYEEKLMDVIEHCDWCRLEKYKGSGVCKGDHVILTIKHSFKPSTRVIETSEGTEECRTTGYAVNFDGGHFENGELMFCTEYKSPDGTKYYG